MNLTEALAAHKSMLDLRREILARLPKTIEQPDWGGKDTFEFELYDVDLDEMVAVYRMYVGRGEYDVVNVRITLSNLFQD